jgi:hypothetical protein
MPIKIFSREAAPTSRFDKLTTGQGKPLHVCFAPQNIILNSSRKGVSRFLLHPDRAGSSKNRKTPFREELRIMF